MKPNHILPLLFTTLLIAMQIKAQSYRITVDITGIRDDKGKLYLSLYHTAEGYPKNASAAFRLSSGQIAQGRCTITLDGIPKGEYAIACYHDENNNGKLDTNFLGVPVEGTGASNDARGSMGPPKFKDAKFVVTSDTVQLIKIHY